MLNFQRLAVAFGASLVLHTLGLLVLTHYWVPMPPMPKAHAPAPMMLVTLLPKPTPTPPKKRVVIHPHVKPPRPKPRISKVVPKPHLRATISAPSLRSAHASVHPKPDAMAGAPALAAHAISPIHKPTNTHEPKLIARKDAANPDVPQVDTPAADDNSTPPDLGSGPGTGTGTTSGSGPGADSGPGQSSGGGPFGAGTKAGSGEGLRHIVYLLDISPSMTSRIERAKSELRLALKGLQPGETFDIIAFAGQTHPFDPNLVSNTPENIAQASHWLDTLSLEDYTNLEGAVMQALSMPDVNVIVIITDGVPTTGETNFKNLAREIHKRNTAHARIYTIGLIGKNPDGSDDSFEARKLLDKIASDSDGTFTPATVGDATP